MQREERIEPAGGQRVVPELLGNTRPIVLAASRSTGYRDGEERSVAVNAVESADRRDGGAGEDVAAAAARLAVHRRKREEPAGMRPNQDIAAAAAEEPALDRAARAAVVRSHRRGRHVRDPHVPPAAIGGVVRSNGVTGAPLQPRRRRRPVRVHPVTFNSVAARAEEQRPPAVRAPCTRPGPR